MAEEFGDANTSQSTFGEMALLRADASSLTNLTLHVDHIIVTTVVPAARPMLPALVAASVATFVSLDLTDSSLVVVIILGWAWFAPYNLLVILVHFGSADHLIVFFLRRLRSSGREVFGGLGVAIELVRFIPSRSLDVSLVAIISRIAARRRCAARRRRALEALYADVPLRVSRRGHAFSSYDPGFGASGRPIAFKDTSAFLRIARIAILFDSGISRGRFPAISTIVPASERHCENESKFDSGVSRIETDDGQF